MSDTPYEQLPGSPYARYNVPIEYLPSRDYKSRWGQGAHPPLPWMMAQFAKHRSEYALRLAAMSDVSAAMKDIPENYVHGQLPLPAWYGVAYAPFDAVALCTMIKEFAPRRFLEIGSGISTCFARFAAQTFDLPTVITSIDPEPRGEIDGICDEVIRDSLENCDLSLFDQLEPGDILFFDGSHRAFMNSDVTVFFGEVIPRLKPGVVIHIHDINLPYDYPESFKHWYWNEQFVLMSLMLGAGDKITPLLPTCYICRDAALMAGFAPQVELKEKAGWFGGGAMWFTLNEPLL
jgi:hypothetical protein